jgi:hypothetical protein
MEIELRRGNLLRLSNQNTVTARSGLLWITEPNNRRDLILRPGQSFTPAPAGLALVEAVTDASLSLSH